MLSPNEFVQGLKNQGIRHFTGVPCSFFQAAIGGVLQDKSLSYTMVPNEGSALALASGAYLAGQPTAVFIQNSGLGNLINPLTSLNMIYDIPALLFISGRAYGVADEPQHEIIGKTMAALLQSIGIEFQDLPDQVSPFESSINHALHRMKKTGKPFVFFVRKNTLSEHCAEKKTAPQYTLKRIEAIKIIAGLLKNEEVVVATTGKPSRELFAVSDKAQHFYMQGSMGHAAAIGLGIAKAQPQKKVIVLDGDGAVLMHMGILSSVGHYKPANFFHIILDNEAYETTGNQDTTSVSTDFAAIAKACGYRIGLQVEDRQALEDSVKKNLLLDGPILLRVKINRIPTEDVPRISSKYDSKTIAQNFKNQLQSGALCPPK